MFSRGIQLFKSSRTQDTPKSHGAERVKVSASRVEDPWFESRLRQEFFGVESYQWLKNWHSNGYPAKRLVL